MIPIKDVDITIPLERYEELITAEYQIKLLGRAYDLGSYKAEYVLDAMFGKRQEAEFVVDEATGEVVQEG